MDSIKISENVYDRQAFLNTKNVSFNELFVKFLSDTSVPTIEDFFDLYNQLFYIIPKEGQYSHTTLVEQSSEYLGLNNSENEDFDALREEITSLREQLYNSESLLAEIQKASTTQ